MSLATLKEIEDILKDEQIDKLIVRALINELRRKLSEYILIDETMRKKIWNEF